MFETYYNHLMTMKKAEIIREGMIWGCWASYECNYKELKKWDKATLARAIVNWMIQEENKRAYWRVR